MLALGELYLFNVYFYFTFVHSTISHMNPRLPAYHPRDGGLPQFTHMTSSSSWSARLLIKTATSRGVPCCSEVD